MATILVVDDSNYTRRVHSKIFENAGHRVVQQSTGMGAIEAYSLERPDLVVLDLSMEDVGGVEVLKTIRALDATANVVVISADVQRTTETSVMEAGATSFIGKPASEAQLLAAISGRRS